MRVSRVLAGAAVLAIGALSASSTRVQAQAPGVDATIASLKVTYDVLKDNITKAAAMVPEDKYKYQPTKDVRTMGQLFGHLANANALICSTATGLKNPSTGDAEKLATKAEITKALSAAFAFCDQAFKAVTAKNANEPVELFGMKHTVAGAMAFNNAHDYEHYGNIVTYMRINGMVPPSSGGK
jgi:uncharacterized damage-inducible protein DinB